VQKSSDDVPDQEKNRYGTVDDRAAALHVGETRIRVVTNEGVQPSGSN